jgi:ubiquinone/menaquinone biosynthesis C-methylase UbiE
MSHTVSHTHHDEGLLIHWAARYDLLVQALTLGGARRLRRRMADAAEVKPGDAVLDVGCGTGDLALVLAERVGPGGTVSGIDASPEMIARARQKARRQGASIDFRNEPVQALSFPDHVFDRVVSSLAFHHFPADIKPQALANIARVLKAGGQVCIIDAMPVSSPHAGSGMAARLTSMYDLAEMLRAAGFTEIRSGRLRFPAFGFTLGLFGIPPLGFVAARTPA